MKGVIHSTCLFLTLGLSLVSAEYLDAIAQVHAEGMSLYLPVSRKLLQEKIDQLEAIAEGPKLYMPTGSVMANQPGDTHPLLVEVSEVVFKDFVDAEAGNPYSYVSTKGMEVTVTIPYLATTPDGPTDYSLGIGVLYDGSRRGIPQSDFLYTYTPVQSITLTETGVKVKDGNAEIDITFGKVTPCDDEDDLVGIYDKRTGARPGVPQTKVGDDAPWSEKARGYPPVAGLSGTAAELYKKVLGASTSQRFREVSGSAMMRRKRSNDDIDTAENLIFSLGTYPVIDFCWFYATGTTYFCDQADLLRNLDVFFGANVCTKWSSNNEVACEMEPGTITVTGWFWHMIPITETTKAMEADQYHGDYDVGAKFPCV